MLHSCLHRRFMTKFNSTLEIPPKTSPSVTQGKAKENRQRFRNIITEISDIICNGRYSTNQILSQALAYLVLSKFCGESNKKENVSLFKLEELLYHFHSVGVGITSQGKIVYISTNFSSIFGNKHCYIGNHISILISQSHEFMYQVFHHHHKQLICDFIQPGKSTIKLLLKGKFMKDGQGNELFLASCQKAATILNTLPSLFSVNEIMLDESFGFVGKQYTYLDRLLGFDVYHDNALDYIVDDDLFSSFANLKQDLLQYGYKEVVVRHYCSDGCFLFVYMKIYSVEINGSVSMVCYCSPFAFGVTDSDIVSETVEHGMRMLSNTDSWFAQLPSNKQKLYNKTMLH